jgi:hypothetical protein
MNPTSVFRVHQGQFAAPIAGLMPPLSKLQLWVPWLIVAP